MKIRPVGAELLHADRRTDGREESNSRFPQFWERALKIDNCVGTLRHDTKTTSLGCYVNDTTNSNCRMWSLIT
jgi:hypothetical protein